MNFINNKIRNKKIMESKFAEITNKGECLSTINVPPAVGLFNWNSLDSIKHLAGRNEWLKDGFYPSDGLVGEVVGTLNHPLLGVLYILKIQGKYYVPMSQKGIRFIAKNEFLFMNR
jgi:hypothetical protein